ncbi:sulfatase family protein [Mucisphaera calidilacus]|uniref:Arylsulfatase n=1 Tax=Mucisphaera calidilacus TaxID=2527982 RepID=A0A518BX25_9BACT|nr:sulfatase-like hydrolase/transferase [Mucisphaera calidilacus]QDU71522.1 Arylsulfatase [Mucisphaera calidilacus]
MPDPHAPNILLIMTDQQRHDTIGALGNAMIRTPNLDRLCDEGVAFRKAYTPCPVCVAARCALLTGVAPHVSGCVDNMPQPQQTASFVNHLADAGYQTHGAGKMHFSPDPLRSWGFDSRDVSEEEEQAGDNDDFRGHVAAAGYGHVLEPHGLRSEFYYLPQPSQLPTRHHHTAWVVDRSLDFLAERDRDRPFFLMTSFIKPHPPFESPEPWSRLYRVPEMPLPFVPEESRELWSYWNQVQNRYKYTDGGDDHYLARMRRAAYYGCISFIDQQVGRLLEALGDDLDDTLILFCSDHGELLGDYGCYGKRSMLDASARVPLIARWPQRLPPGEVVDRPATLLDIAPTAFDAAGLRDHKPSPEGESLIDLAADRCQRDVVYGQFQRGEYALYMAVTERDKYIYSAADNKAYYLDHEHDPRESRNAIGDPASRARVRSLQQSLIDRHTRDHDTLAVSHGDWREYPPRHLQLNADEALLFQDSARLQPTVDRLEAGYARNVTVSDGAAIRLLSARPTTGPEERLPEPPESTPIST